jgi:hypothetical protein
MKINNLDTGKSFSLKQCKNNHVPASFLRSSSKRLILIDGVPATMMVSPDTVRYIVVQDTDGFNFYFYGYEHVGSTNFKIA